MKVFHHPDSLAHAPPLFYRQGALVGHPEQPGRAELLLRAAKAAGHTAVAVGGGTPAMPPGEGALEIESQDLAALLRVHDSNYLSFLSEAWSRRDELPKRCDSLIATHMARPQMRRRPTALAGQIGYYMADTSTPLLAETWRSVLASARVALSAGRAVLDGQDKVAYALCRPPGHHAYADSAGGFCYLNNTAIVAAEIAARAGSASVLDIDVHAGNGTQGIFYERADVTTVSVHVDPGVYFPFFAGYADERGRGAGDGHNLNLPLPLGAEDDVWLDALRRGLDAAIASRPSVLVVALGLDASEHDPLKGMAVTLGGFAKAGRMIAGARWPTVLVQEGGYLQPALGEALAAFLAGFSR